ncbi:hypothetical protein RJV41_01690 [Buchnera aphidicola (Neophyllaphis podocarpi)]|uniref:hypothetical protein n=1 Tax=Buchnera aphidicola TaxID=9 RepID=UPI0031B824A2
MWFYKFIFSKKKVISEQADIGLAFDGDGDRMIMIDHLGNIVCGDKIIYIIAKYFKNIGILKGGVVFTYMSNKGLIFSLKKLNIPFKISKVGDRCILKKLQKNKWNLGAESSGHIILLDKSFCSDGIISSLEIISIMIINKLSLHSLSSEVNLFPQVILNFSCEKYFMFIKHKKYKYIINKSKKLLGNDGRIIIRKSGTEPIFRILIESKFINIVQTLSKKISNFINGLNM